MDPNESRNESVADGVFEEIAAQNHDTFTQQGRPDRAATDPAATGATGPQSDHPKTKKQTKTKTEDEDEAGDNAAGLDTQDFSRRPVPSRTEAEEETETSEDDATSQTDSSQDDADVDWATTLPPDPGEFKGKAPVPDQDGRIDPNEYTAYLKASIKHESAVDAYNNAVVTAAFDAIEKILPEIKTNPALRQAVEGTFASTLSGQAAVQLAKSLRATIDKVALTNKTAGANNAKTSIQIQRNAAIESKGSTQKRVTTSKSDNLDRRLKANDQSAFEELMGEWLEKGKV